MPGPLPSRWRSAARARACRSARTSGIPRSAATWPRWGRDLHFAQRQPYEIDKDDLRIDGVAKRRAIDTASRNLRQPRSAGQDEVVFDGASFVVGLRRAVGAAARLGRAVVATAGPACKWAPAPAGAASRAKSTSSRTIPRTSIARWSWRCATTSTATAFPGGAGHVGRDRQRDLRGDRRRRLRPERVWCVMLPSRYTSQTSLDDPPNARG
jgi:NAD+ synthase